MADSEPLSGLNSVAGERGGTSAASCAEVRTLSHVKPTGVAFGFGADDAREVDDGAGDVVVRPDAVAVPVGEGEP
ncbi:hypothetical protein GCM10028798_36160 [Humibacter antri]